MLEPTDDAAEHPHGHHDAHLHHDRHRRTRARPGPNRTSAACSPGRAPRGTTAETATVAERPASSPSRRGASEPVTHFVGAGDPRPSARVKREAGSRSVDNPGVRPAFVTRTAVQPPAASTTRVGVAESASSGRWPPRRNRDARADAGQAQRPRSPGDRREGDRRRVPAGRDCREGRREPDRRRPDGSACRGGCLGAANQQVGRRRDRDRDEPGSERGPELGSRRCRRGQAERRSPGVKAVRWTVSE